MEPSGNDGVPFETAEKIILRWDSTASEEARDRMIFYSDRSEIERYLQAVDEINTSMKSASITDEQSSVMQAAMARLEDEFRNILITHTTPIETDSIVDRRLSTHSRIDSTCGADLPEADFTDENDASKDTEFVDVTESSTNANYRSVNSIRQIDLIPSEAIYDLRSIAERMVSAGYLREFVQVYGSVRKPVLDASLRRLGVEKMSIGDIQRLDWAELVTKINCWIRAAKVCVRVLFASEKNLCEQIFRGLAMGADDACFMETVKGPAIQLLNFAESISISRRSPEKLFKMLDLHDALSELSPNIDGIFESKLSESIRVQATEIISRLAEAARGILSEFENAVLREPSTVPVPGGTIHPLTRYVMNYVNYISDYKQTLTELVVSKPLTESRNSQGSVNPVLDIDRLDVQTPLALHMIWIIVILQFNLEGKSKNYKDPSLAHFLIMNNLHYIVQKINECEELREMIGDYYLRKLKSKTREAAISYQRATWVKVLHCLRDEGLHVKGNFSSGVSKSALRERFKSFNSIFEDVHKTQATWFVRDVELRDELRISISDKLIPAYRSFLGRFRSHIESENYIKYSVEDLETAVLDLFEGCSVPQHHLRRRSE